MARKLACGVKPLSTDRATRHNDSLPALGDTRRFIYEGSKVMMADFYLKGVKQVCLVHGLSVWWRGIGGNLL
jgi:hypothetical protein